MRPSRQYSCPAPPGKLQEAPGAGGVWVWVGGGQTYQRRSRRELWRKIRRILVEAYMDEWVSCTPVCVIFSFPGAHLRSRRDSHRGLDNSWRTSGPDRGTDGRRGRENSTGEREREEREKIFIFPGAKLGMQQYAYVDGTYNRRSSSPPPSWGAMPVADPVQIITII